MEPTTLAILGAVAGGAAAMLFLKRGKVPDDLKERVASGEVLLVDVREPGEWKAGHLKHAKSVPLSTLRSGVKPKLDKKKPLYLHCRSGSRVRMAKPILEGMGFAEVHALGAGYSSLVAKGFEKA